MPDPAAVDGTDEARDKAFLDTFVTMKRRIELMLALPLQSLDRMALRKQVQEIGAR
jgi:arsenate reductase